MLTKEQELADILITEKVDIIFLTETDKRMLINEECYRISGYKTILPHKKENSELVRIVCLIKEEIVPYIKVRSDLMSCEFPSIWLDYNPDLRIKPVKIAGFGCIC